MSNKRKGATRKLKICCHGSLQKRKPHHGLGQGPSHLHREQQTSALNNGSNRDKEAGLEDDETRTGGQTCCHTPGAPFSRSDQTAEGVVALSVTSADKTRHFTIM